MYRIVAIALIACGCASSASDGAPAAPGNGHGGSNAAGGSGSNLENPTGDCVAPDDGSRAGYHGVGTGDTWLPDCDSTLSLEYFRVFVQQDGTAYLMPRPDGFPSYLADACSDTSHALHDTVDSYTLCADSARVDIERVNAMDVVDALAIAHHLNGKLVFVAEATDVRPYAIPSDILLLCQQDDAFRNGPMKERCDFEIEADETGDRTDIGWSHTGQQGVVLAAKLNELYGVTGENLCDRLTGNARVTLDLAIRGAPNTCQVDDDCVLVGRASECHDSCAAVAATSAQASIDETRAAIDSSTCRAFTVAQCPAVIHPPCIPLLGACVDGVCVEE